MIKIENVEIYGWEAAIRGMRNPKNSWDKSDSHFDDCHQCMNVKETECRISNMEKCILIGENDLKLAKMLAAAGSVHGKFLRMITVTMDINAPLYWWKEYDTYKVGTVADSCSTMHKIHSKKFTIDDFSTEHLTGKSVYLLEDLIKYLNAAREAFVVTKNKDYWWQLIQLLPTSYNQLRTVQLNYSVLANIYEYRKDHKLDEWRTFCDWIETLPYSELITD